MRRDRSLLSYVGRKFCGHWPLLLIVFASVACGAVGEDAPLYSIDNATAMPADTTPSNLKAMMEKVQAGTENSVPPPAESPAPDAASKKGDDKVIFGENDILDQYELDSEEVGSWGDAVCAFVPRNMLAFNGTDWELVNVRDYVTQTDVYEPDSWAYTTKDVKPCSAPCTSPCPRERFAGQVTAPLCSGFLVGFQLVATAAHCIQDDADLANYWIVFGFVQEGPGPSQYRKFYPTTHVYEGARITRRRFIQGGGIDHCLIELDRSTIDMPCVWPLSIHRQANIAVGTQIGTIGHPQGLPRKYSFGANTTVKDPGDRHWFAANLDSYKGNSGSPVINPATGLVEGILVMGPDTEFDFSSNSDPNPRPDPCDADKTPPVIIMIGDATITLQLCPGDPVPTLPGVVAWDACEGDLTSSSIMWPTARAMRQYPGCGLLLWESRWAAIFICQA
jgi:V8-like Glu-specific endopeptidase